MDSNDGYVCSLDEATVKKAKEEINEEPADRLNAVDALRQWVLQQPHLNCRTDTVYLLSFLRGAKFSQLKARQMIGGFLTVKTKIPQWFGNLDTRDENSIYFLERGYIVPLPGRDENGCKVTLIRTGIVDKEKFKTLKIPDLVRYWLIFYQYLVERDEMSQVNGHQFLIDMGNTSTKMATVWTVDDMRRWYASFQGHIPGRFKAFHHLYPSTAFELIHGIAKPFMSKKFSERTILHNTLESVYKHIPKHVLPLEYLPDDYKGPNNGHLADIIAQVKANMTSDKMRDDVMWATSDKWGVDESKRPKAADVPEQASFRKINVD